MQAGDRERVSLFVDDLYVCAISVEQAVKLRKGQALDADELAALRAEGELDLAYQRSLRYLGARPRSRAEVSAYLLGKNYDDAVVNAVLERLAARGYVDDEAFARFWVENRNRFRPRGARALRYELRQKGIEPAVIDETLAEQDEETAAWQVVAGKLARWRELEWAAFEQRVMGLLARRGFGYDTCRRICARAWEEVAQAPASGAANHTASDDIL